MAKSEKKSKLKLKTVLIAIFIIIVILVIILLILLNQSSDLVVNEATKKLEYINNSEEWEDETIYPDYSALLKNAYNGDLDSKSLGKSMYYVATEVFPKYYEELKNASETRN